MEHPEFTNGKKEGIKHALSWIEQHKVAVSLASSIVIFIGLKEWHEFKNKHEV